jgi:hypothetical protein
MADKIFPEGIKFFAKSDKAPDFVVGTMVITPAELVQFIKDNASLLVDYNGTKQLKLQVLKSQKGGLYAQVDTWKPSARSAAVADDSDLPF